MQVDDDEIIPVNNANTTACPICRKRFPNEQIEVHASECDAFSTAAEETNICQPSTSRSRSVFLKCEICNKYSTHDGNNYAEHVVKCKEKAEDRRNGNT